MKRLLILPLSLAAALAGGAVRIVQDQCGPFTDVSPAFCPFVLELYYLGIAAGTSATTYSPDDPLTRGQAAVFVAKGLNQSIARSSRRAALGQWWQGGPNFALTAVGDFPSGLAADGADIWLALNGGPGVYRIRASDGRVLEFWTGAAGANRVLVAMGSVFVVGGLNPGVLYRIDPATPPTDVETLAPNLGGYSGGIAFDGSRIWVSNVVGGVSIVTPAATTPWPVTTVATGFTGLTDVLFDGTDIWVADNGARALHRLDASGAIVTSVPLGSTPSLLTFDGTNIWVPGVGPDSVTIVRASTGSIVQVLTGNGISQPVAAAFDGTRVLVTNNAGNSVSVWKAADLSPLGSWPIFGSPFHVCSDGVHFWIALSSSGQLARF